MKQQKTGRQAKLKWKPTNDRFAKEDSSSMRRQARVKRCICKRKIGTRLTDVNERMQKEHDKKLMRAKHQRKFSESKTEKREEEKLLVA